ncbi:MAG: hypothetical protein JWM02_1292 [Frankiales bacterium]|nr:hypothetical protein [Frankiales bacterium]
MPAAALAGLTSIPQEVGRSRILGIDLVGSLTRALSRLVSDAIQSFASYVFAQLSKALLATTAVPLDKSFDAPWRAMVTVAALFALPILLIGVTSEILAGRPGQALRRGVALPLLIGPVLLASRAAVALVVAVIQGLCGVLVQVGLGGNQGFAEGLDRMRKVLGVATGPADPTGAGASLVVVLVAGLLAFVIWIELAVRAALVLLLAAFVPLALSGLFWSATARWTRRLLESLAAVLLAPLVITMVMVLATATLTAPADGLAQGIDHAAIALALLFLGTLGLPLTFRLIPHVVEAAVVTGAGASIARRAQRGATRAVAAVAPVGAAGRLAAAPAAASASTSAGSAATGGSAPGARSGPHSSVGAGSASSSGTSAPAAGSRVGTSPGSGSQGRPSGRPAAARTGRDQS